MHEVAAAFIICGGLVCQTAAIQKRDFLLWWGICIIIFASGCVIF